MPGLSHHWWYIPNLSGLTLAQVLARVPEQDARYRQGDAGLRAILGEVGLERQGNMD